MEKTKNNFGTNERLLAPLDENTEIRTVIDIENGEILYSMTDVIYVYLDLELRQAARDYWYVVKSRLKKNRNASEYIDCYKCKSLSLDGKRHPTDFMDVNHIYKTLTHITYSKVNVYKGFQLLQIISEEEEKRNWDGLLDMLQRVSVMPRVEVDPTVAEIKECYEGLNYKSNNSYDNSYVDRVTENFKEIYYDYCQDCYDEDFDFLD